LGVSAQSTAPSSLPPSFSADVCPLRGENPPFVAALDPEWLKRATISELRAALHQQNQIVQQQALSTQELERRRRRWLAAKQQSSWMEQKEGDTAEGDERLISDREGLSSALPEPAFFLQQETTPSPALPPLLKRKAVPPPPPPSQRRRL
jgi:hypothetical protein